MDDHYEDTVLLLPALKDLWYQGRIPTRLYRVFFSTRKRGVSIPITVGELRHALAEHGTPILHSIPDLGRASITRLRRLFDHIPPDLIERTV